MAWWVRTLIGAGIGALCFGGAASVAAPNPGLAATALGAGMGLVIGAFIGLTNARR